MDKAYKEIAGQVNIPGFHGVRTPRIIDQHVPAAPPSAQVVSRSHPATTPTPST